MAGKTLNAKNLEALGSERLAELVMDLVQGSAPLKREARAALLEASGSEALAGEVRKRLATIKRSKTYVSWKKRKALLRDLTQQRDIIVTRIAPRDPAIAHDLLWQFMALTDDIFRRVNDDQGVFGTLFVEACESLPAIAIAAKIDAAVLADFVFTAVTEHSDSGVFNGLIEQMADALGETGINALKARFDEALADPDWDEDAVLRIGLMALADLAGDPDAYAEQYQPTMRAMPRVAAKIATRLLAADRAAEALAMLDEADTDDGIPQEWVDARIAALEACGRVDEAQEMRWKVFTATFAPDYLRDYLKRLPDFEDVEAEDRGLDHVEAKAPIYLALTFLIEWPALERAAALVMARRGAFDGNRFYALTPAADLLEAKHPLAATVLRRSMIEDTLNGAKSSRYKHAARHLLECESADAVIESYGAMVSHERFVAGLRDRHGRKYGFWDLVAT
jgi:hypothetical protein